MAWGIHTTELGAYRRRQRGARAAHRAIRAAGRLLCIEAQRARSIKARERREAKAAAELAGKVERVTASPNPIAPALTDSAQHER